MYLWLCGGWEHITGGCFSKNGKAYRRQLFAGLQRYDLCLRLDGLRKNLHDLGSCVYHCIRRGADNFEFECKRTTLRGQGSDVTLLRAHFCMHGERAPRSRKQWIRSEVFSENILPWNLQRANSRLAGPQLDKFAHQRRHQNWSLRRRTRGRASFKCQGHDRANH